MAVCGDEAVTWRTHLCQHCLAVTSIFLFKGNRPPIVRWQVAEIMTCFQHSNWSFEEEHTNYIASDFVLSLSLKAL